MSRSVRLVLTLAVLGALAIGNVTSVAAGGAKVIDSELAGIPTPGLTINGVIGGGAPWVIDSGRARLFADGRLEVDINGLVLAASRTNPVASGHAIVTCDGAPAATTDNVPFSPSGDAQISTFVKLPVQCLAPAVFFTTGTDRWLAVTAF
jgi:hypothetical protein